MLEASYHHGSLRQATLNAALSLLQARGIDGWSLRDLAKQVDTSAPALHHDFANKEVLLATVAQDVLKRIKTLRMFRYSECS
jgi:AcrR family transcriptional regulator